ncbi:L-histidine N(alpha)-methyltransferase [Dyadobacter subterraneus]|uniref:L-histidine N(Alpha)-methyltransferase n=1 Tax=Dyadobacter subterraneus TaxID=2773304 RepID=A0ABR9W759_9BACT|nr:L-histidine N(alpha)-methyltransferase [Dyadobacter subterraneus]MBE9461300.1 L-histidine N(alpha)-methyltransferase [Dyadobacter subterraneus]
MNATQNVIDSLQIHKNFLEDVTAGLTCRNKFLQPKYFYDLVGDSLFQDIMVCPEYYLSRAELEIISDQKTEILNQLPYVENGYDVVELGAGDASKSIHLLNQAMLMGLSNHYIPIDISSNIIDYLDITIPKIIDGISVKGVAQEYCHALQQINTISQKTKLVLFLGTNIGNMTINEATIFCKNMKTFLAKGDHLIIGFDLKKDPSTILSAYNDSSGITKAFNLNLLTRINTELGANFNLDCFEHYPVYDPGTGACKSYLISKRVQRVSLYNGTQFYFQKDEPIYMEVSQKYDLQQIRELAQTSGFSVKKFFIDKENKFVDALWEIQS